MTEEQVDAFVALIDFTVVIGGVVAIAGVLMGWHVVQKGITGMVNFFKRG